MSGALQRARREALGADEGLPADSLIAAAIVFLGVALRFYRIGAQSLWYDEAFAVTLSRQSVAGIIANVEAGHPPLYFLLLHACTRVAGESELAVRYLSAWIGVAAVALSYALGSRLFGRRLGLVVALIAAVSPLYVYYSQETRMYGLVAAEATLATYLLVRALAGERRHWATYALAAAALLYTHYYGLMLVIAQSVFVAGWLGLAWRRVSPSHPERTAFPGWLAAELAIALLFLPWAITRAGVYEEYVSAARGSLSLGAIVVKSLIAFSTGHSVELANPDPGDPLSAKDHLVAAWLAVGFGLVAAAGLLNARLRRSGPFHTGLLALTLVVVPALAVFAVSLGRREFTARYLISVAPVFYVLLACGLDALRRRSVWLAVPVAAFLLGAMGFSLANYYWQPRYARDDFRAVAAYLRERSRPDEAVICDAGYSSIALDYYRLGQSPCVRIPPSYPPNRDDSEGRATALAGSRGFLWLLLWQDYYADPEQWVEKWLDVHAYPVSERRFHGGIRVKGYLTNPPIVAEAAVPNRVDQALGGLVALVGYQLSPVVAGGETHITLYWKALAPLPVDYTAFVHLVDARGELWAQHDSPPVNARYPTSGWQPGEVIADEHVLTLPALSPPVEYRLEVGMYEPATLRRLGSPGQDSVAIPHVRAERAVGPGPAIPNGVSAVFGGDRVALRGYEVLGARRGGELSLVLYWEALAPVGADYTVFVHLLDAAGNLVAQGDSPPTGGIYPTSAWPASQAVRDPHHFAVPAAVPPGQYRLVVGLYQPSTGARLSVKPNWWSAADDKLTLATVRLE